MSYSAEVLADSPGAYYRMGESSGNLADSSGNGNPAGASGGPTYSQPGLLTSDATTCILFASASSQRFSVGDNANNDPGDVFTLEAWIKRPSNNNAYSTILSKGLGAACYRISNTSRLEVLNSQTALIAASTTTITDTSRHHVVTTKNGVTTKLYIDSVDVTGTVTNSTCATNALPFTIGADVTAGPAYNTFADLYIQEAAIYPTALSAARVLAHYSAGVGGATGGMLRMM